MSPLFTKARFSLALAATLASSPLYAEDLRVGLAAPLSGEMALLGAQLRDGAMAAGEGREFELIVADDRCNADGGTAAAQQFIDQKVQVVIGFLCAEALETALPALSNANIPVIVTGVRADRFTDQREREGWLVWRIAPRQDAEKSAIADLLVRAWRSDLFAIVDDGTIYGRDLAETFRLAAENAGLKPAFVDTFRPQSENQVALVGRLARSGVSKVFVGGDRDDIAVIARDARERDAAMVVAGGEALKAASAITLPQGVLMVGIPEQAAPEREGYAVYGEAAVQIALKAHGESEKGLADTLSTTTFETSLGPISLDAKGDLAQNPYRLLRYDGQTFAPVGAQ